MLVFPDGIVTPENFTAFLTSPVNIEDDDDNNTNLLKLAIREKFDNSDLLLFTKMEVTISMGTTDLKYCVKTMLYSW